jgi:Mor family transcriptional regulator
MGQKMTDIITSIIEEIKIHVEHVTPEIASKVERVIRGKFGGEQAYIAKRCALIDSKKQTINAELRAGRSIVQIEQLHGIPRRTIYRIINQKTQRG